MTKKPPKDIDASVRGRLLRIATDRGEDFQRVLTAYANERLLFRLAQSPHASRFVLKGAALFTVWTGRPYRMTRDVDLLGFGEPSAENVRRVFAEVLAMPVADGVRFDLKTLQAGLIREEQQYGGVRVELVARLTTAQVRLQIDVGFGDAITPEAVVVDYPALLDFAAPRLRAYPRETFAAEKFEAMVQLGMANSRMKDFYDLAILAREFDFEGQLLARAFRATFERRQTRLPSTRPVALTEAFSADPSKRTQWSAFTRKAGIENADDLSRTVTAIAGFVDVPLTAARTGEAITQRWKAGGPWM
jgi:hypothetical protein